MTDKLKAAYKTDVGRQREQNEDYPYVFITEEQERGLFIVADGMGGYRAGEVASKMAVEKMRESLNNLLIPISEQPTIKLNPVADQETVILDATRAAELAKLPKTRKLTETNQLKNIEEQLKNAVRNAN
ncbi:MAG TPA: protein phosphatase 2C domain-containing protein, partial [Ktedonobacteraceae bacterium]|nr:protein phosphatase 2C domain-containing protein [Ktedonobacteraceae bacterium]